MRARVHDATGRLELRLVLLAFAAALLLAPVWGVGLGRYLPLAIGLGGLLALLVPALPSGTTSRDVELRLGFGWIEIRRLGKARRGQVRRGVGPWRRVEGTRLGGARIAHAAEGASLALERAAGAPLLLELRDEADARAVQAALAVDPAASGALGWAMERSSLEGLADLVLGVGALAFVALAAAGMAPGARWSRLPLDMPVTLAMVGVGCALLAPVLRAVGLALRPRMALEKEGVRVGRSDGVLVPYVLIADVTEVGEGLELQLKSLDDTIANHPRLVPLHGLSPIERAHVATHVLALARDAQGWGRGRRADTLRVLRRGDGEPVAGWLTRIDALAPGPVEGTPRDLPARHALAPEDLARMIDDPTSPRDVRIAAARVLRRVDPEAARARVAPVDPGPADDEAAQVQAAVEAAVEEATAAYDALRPAFRSGRGVSASRR